MITTDRIALFFVCVLSPSCVAAEFPQDNPPAVALRNPRELTQPGNVLTFRPSTLRPDDTPDKLVVTIVRQDEKTVSGLVSEVPSWMIEAPVPKELPRKLDGVFEGSTLKWTESEFDLQTGDFHPSWYCEGTLSEEWTDLRRGYAYPLTNGSKLNVQSVSRIDSDALDAAQQSYDDALLHVQKRWTEIRDDVSSLRKKGHVLRVKGGLENGEIALEWQDYGGGPDSATARL